MFKKLKLIIFRTAIFLGISSQTYAQTNDQPINQEITSCHDPIIEMLDSLVTLNNVIRYNSFNGTNASTQTNSSVEDPFVSEDVYRQRIAKIITPIPLSYNSLVRNYIDIYASKKRDLTSRMLGLSHLYFPLFEEILDKEGLPLEFKYLSVVESALNPTAVSQAGATGIWQFMLSTGKLYNLKVSSYTDERRDPLKATYAACNYFKDMYKIYRDWLLVIAAYNCGPGNVNKAIIRSGGKTNFWEICRYLPAETRGYVPAFIAVCYVMNYSKDHNIVPVIPAFSYFEVDTLRVRKKTTLSKIANSINLPLDVVSFLNPIYKKGIIPETEIPQIVRLPANKSTVFLNNENSIYSTDAEEASPILARLKFTKTKTEEENNSSEYSYEKIKTTHVVRRGETISGLADAYNCSATDIKKLNKLKSNKLQAGQKLKIFTWTRIYKPVNDSESAESIKKNSNDSSLLASEKQTVSVDQTTDSVKDLNDTDAVVTLSYPEKDKSVSKNKPKYIYHLVQRGDTLWSIAKRYEGVSVDQIAELNNISNKRSLKTGTKLKVKVVG